MAEAGEGFLGRVAELELEPRIVSFRQLGVCLAERVEELLGRSFHPGGGTPLPWLGSHQLPREQGSLPAASSRSWGQRSGCLHVLLQNQGGAGGRRVTLSLCEQQGGGGSAPRKQMGPRHRHAGLKPLRGQVGEFSYRPWAHVLRVLELLLLVVVPLGQDVEQKEVTENRGLRGAGGGQSTGVWGQDPEHPTSIPADLGAQAECCLDSGPLPPLSCPSSGPQFPQTGLGRWGRLRKSEQFRSGFGVGDLLLRCGRTGTDPNTVTAWPQHLPPRRCQSQSQWWSLWE